MDFPITLKRKRLHYVIASLVTSVLIISIGLPTLSAISADTDNNTSSLPPDKESASAAQRFGKIELQAPRLQALISITKSMDPFRLDAVGSRTVSLRDVLELAITKNLDIQIRQTDVKSKDWTLFSSYGSFLPNLQMGYRYQYLKGKVNIPLAGLESGNGINTPFIITNAGFNYYGYQGGKVLFTALQNRNYLHASKFQQKATLSDTLFETTRRYQNLVLSEALLQIRIRAVETSEAQLTLNQNLLQGGKATRLDLLQARTQLSSDRQKLIDQQIARRNAALELADLLNVDQGIDLVPDNRVVDKHELIADTASPAALLKTAVENRPELKQYRELWLAARKTAKIDAAKLQPTFQFFGTSYGIGETLTASSKTETTAINPITLAPVPLGTPGSAPIEHRESRQISPLYTLGYIVNWNINGLGSTDLGNIESARAQSRQAMLELNKKLNSITKEVRQSYLGTLSAYRKLDETIAKVDSATEELRLSQMRFQYGVGKNIDVLKAQEDYTSALIENAQAMITYNISQAQLLRDTGIISTDYLLSTTPIKLE